MLRRIAGWFCRPGATGSSRPVVQPERGCDASTSAAGATPGSTGIDPQMDSRPGGPCYDKARGPTVADAPPPAAKHAPRLRRMSRMPVERLGLFNRRWRTALRGAGVCTATDFLTADAQRLARRLKMPDKVVAKISQRQAAVRLAALLPPLAPRDALLLIAVHRRDLRKLATESPGRLHRDLARFALSTAGQALLRGKVAPDLDAVRSWIAAARERSGLRDQK